ncbi:MAG: hypothetical protein HYX43_10505 [Burkholderiales bacterium]|nr:hypothetical protein [Burkholderiales bacterium]
MRRMVHQGTFLDWVEDQVRDCAGMLRRRIPLATTLRVLVIGGASGVFGPVALAAQDANLLLAVALPILLLEAALRLRR